MLGLATFIMRGRSQAALVAAVFAVLSLLFPLAGMLSSATVALVTLRLGPVEGLIVGAFAGLASGLFAFAALGSPAPALGFALALWLPVWALGLGPGVTQHPVPAPGGEPGQPHGPVDRGRSADRRW